MQAYIAELRMINSSRRYRLTACSDRIYSSWFNTRTQEPCILLFSGKPWGSPVGSVCECNFSGTSRSADQTGEGMGKQLLSQCQSLSNYLSPGCSSSSLHNKGKIVPQWRLCHVRVHTHVDVLSILAMYMKYYPHMLYILSSQVGALDLNYIKYRCVVNES